MGISTIQVIDGSCGRSQEQGEPTLACSRTPCGYIFAALNTAILVPPVRIERLKIENLV